VPLSFDLVVFDVAGTTLHDDDNAVADAFIAALAGAGVAITPAQADPVMGLPKPLAVERLLAQRRGVAPPPEEVARVHAAFQRAMIGHYASATGVAEVTGASGLFADLRGAGVRVALDTGFDRAILDTILRRVGWSELVDATITSDEVERGRPHPDMIAALMERLGVRDAARVCKVGDSVSDIEEGINAGCGLVVAVRNARTEAALDTHEGVRAIERLYELRPLLGLAADTAGVA